MQKTSEMLRARGYVYQHSGESLEEIVDGRQRTVYLGVDPTADSLHVGHLVTYLLVRHLAEVGHKVILIVGGGTGLIGDPRDTEERPLSDEAEVEARVEKLRAQVERVVGTEVMVVNNADWLKPLSLLDFLRDIGKHFTVNSLIKKETIQTRLENESPLSYTEFAYPVLQAYDFMHLFREYGCDVQVGGSDQWGNITAGVELIRKKLDGTAYAVTVPLVIDKKSGRKFGKSEGNAVWLDPQKTSPFEFYQFWLTAEDESVEEYLKLYTLLSLSEIEEIMNSHQENPSARVAQKALGRSVTEFVHGRASAHAAEHVSKVLFEGVSLEEITGIDRDVLLEAAPVHRVSGGDTLLEALVASELASSNREARQFLESGAISLNGNEMKDGDLLLSAEHFVNDLALLKRGKRNATLLVFG